MACNNGTSKWPLVRRIRWLRILQYVLSGVIIAVSAWLVSFLNSHDGRLGGAATVPLIVAPLTFILTVMQQWFGTHLSGYHKRGCLILFIFFDVVCIGLQVPLIVTLAVAGLPANCNGVANGLDSDIFGGSGHGLTKQYCAAPNSSFWMAIILMLSYIYTISLIIRQIVSVSREMKQRRADQKTAESNDRINAIRAHHAPVPRQNRPQWDHHTETVDLRDESVRDTHSRGQETPIFTPTSSSVVGEEPPPYIPDEEPDLAKNLKKN